MGQFTGFIEKLGFEEQPMWWALKDCVPVPLDFERALFFGEPIMADDDSRVVHQHMWFGTKISTVFLGLDHAFMPVPKGTKNYQPIIFETMVFGGPLDDYQDRYRTWEQAERGHRETCRRVIVASIWSLLRGKVPKRQRTPEEIARDLKEAVAMWTEPTKRLH